MKKSNTSNHPELWNINNAGIMKYFGANTERNDVIPIVLLYVSFFNNISIIGAG